MTALVISILILHGLIGKMASLRTAFARKIHAGILRQLTGIWDRAELIERFGPHDNNYYFPITSLKQVWFARRISRWIFGNLWLEIILVAALLYIVMGNALGYPLQQTIIVGAGVLYFIINSFLTLKQSIRSKQQFEEEVDVLRQQRIARFKNNSPKS